MNLTQAFVLIGASLWFLLTLCLARNVRRLPKPQLILVAEGLISIGIWIALITWKAKAFAGAPPLWTHILTSAFFVGTLLAVLNSFKLLRRGAANNTRPSKRDPHPTHNR